MSLGLVLLLIGILQLLTDRRREEPRRRLWNRNCCTAERAVS
ncbi:hypothetical protein NJ7G_1094 [Natrinema sp. J7-2]|nr:hypothetical protein NJ7G_1094 [Natrinema sp. J7-2]